MVTVTLRVYEGKELLYTEAGKASNPNQLIKINEYYFENKFLKLFRTMGFCKIELIGAEENGTPVSAEKLNGYNEMLKVATGKAIPVAEAKPEDAEKDYLTKQNQALMDRLAALEQKMQAMPSKEPEQIKIDVEGEPKTIKAPKAPKKTKSTK